MGGWLGTGGLARGSSETWLLPPEPGSALPPAQGYGDRTGQRLSTLAPEPPAWPHSPRPRPLQMALQARPSCPQRRTAAEEAGGPSQEAQG